MTLLSIARRVTFACMFVAAIATGWSSLARAQTGSLPQEAQELQSLLDSGDAAAALPRCETYAAEHPEEQMAWFLLARARHAAGNLEGAVEAGLEAVKFPGVRASSYYNLACAYALLGRHDEAITALDDAKRAGFMNRELMKTDTDLDAVRGDPRFVLPVERIYDVLDVGDEVGLPYSIQLPVDFDANRAYPVLVGPGDADPAMAMTASLFWGEDSSQRGWLVVESPLFLAPDPVSRARKLLDRIASVYKVEGGKFHAAGFSANSVGVFDVVAAMPERFHTVTGMPGYPRWEKDEDLLVFKGVVMNFIVGQRDPAWIDDVRLAHERLDALGVETYLEIIPGAGHVLEELFGGEFMDRLDVLR